MLCIHWPTGRLFRLRGLDGDGLLCGIAEEDSAFVRWPAEECAEVME